MNQTSKRVRVGVVAFVLAAGCMSLQPKREPLQPPIPLEQLEIDEEVTELYAMMRHDWAILDQRLAEIPVRAVAPPPVARPKPRPPAAPPQLTADSVLASICIPVAGVRHSQLEDSYGAPRDGGRRRHHGIDIKAPRGTRVIAVADGEISYVGTQNKAGKSVWLVTDAGVSFFYAHLDHWASGLREGQKVQKGELLGYVGNTGNARRSSPHLHFAIHRDSKAINPYPHLLYARLAEPPRPVLAGGLIAGSQ